MDKAHVAEQPFASLESMLAAYYPNGEPIAVVGHACRFPEADDAEQFWRNLVEGRECSRRFSRRELLDAGLDAATIDAPNFVNVGTVVPDADAFDAELFGYSRQEAELIDPQQRLFLQIVWHALEHAGYAPRETPHRTGVFGSTRISTYPGREPLRLAEVAQVRGLQSLMGNDKDYVATRAAYKLNLRGPALSVQTACSSSLVAVHLACESLRAGECDMAVAGGVAISFPQQAGYLHQPGMIFSPDGRCRPFDAQAQGTFPGAGVAAVTLRRLGDALRDGDPVVAVLLGSATNNDGDRKAGFTAPSVAGQRNAIGEAMALAGVGGDQIGLIEAHGTATPLGDPIEVQALKEVFGEAPAGTRCALGSVKSNLGHLDTAAGIASLLKAVLSVERSLIPPSLHFAAPNPALGLEGGPFYVPTAAEPWNTPVRIAGVSSFGIGGTNCHVLVASLPAEIRAALETPPATTETAPALLLSAASESGLRRLAGIYAEALVSGESGDLAYTALQGRQLDLAYRLAAPLEAETSAALAAFAAGEDDILLHHGQGSPGKQLWLFSGQGAHWPGMGKALYAQSPAFAAALDRCLAACDGAAPDLLREAVLGERGDLLEQMEFAQPAIVAFEIAMAEHWRALGLEPDAVIGHSVGEYAAAVVAGFYDVEQVMPLVRLRGVLMQSCLDGAMISVFADEATALPLARRFELDVAAYNGARHLVLSGPRSAVDALAEELTRQDIRHNRLTVAGAAHSRLLDPVLDEFQREAARLRAAPGRLPQISALLARPIEALDLNGSDYWRRHLREPVRYMPALEQALDLGADLCLEVGPDSPLTGIGLREAPHRARWIASAKRRQPAGPQLDQALMQLYAAGAALPWRELLARHGRKLHAPLYPFEKERCWREAAPAPQAPGPEVDHAMAEGRRVAVEAAAMLELPRLQALYACVTQLHAVYVDRLVRRCVGDRIEHGATVLDILRGGRLLPRYRQLLTRLLNACVEDGYYRRAGEAYTPALPAPHDRCAALLGELRSYCEGLDVIADTVARAGENLHAMMSGAIEPVEVIFPEGASSGVEVLYQEFSFGRYFNEIAAGVVAGLMRERLAAGRSGRPFRILEVGGGTGGTTAWLLPELVGQPGLRYDFTDISAIFTRRAEQKFAEHDFLRYAEFDLQKDAGEQGFEAGAYDLIVAANVIHATQHVGRTLENLRPLLKPGGRLLMREITRPMRLFDFVFGPLVLPLHDEQARGGELFLTTEHWKQACLQAGFDRVEWLPEDDAPTAAISEHIVLAAAPGQPAAALPIALAEPADPLLGQALSDAGIYLADWSDCAGRDERWRERLGAAAAELSRRHGDGRSIPLESLPAEAPQGLGLVRLQWLAGAFGRARIIVEARDETGGWRVLPPRAAAPELAAPTSALQTWFDWSWRPHPEAPAEALAVRCAPRALAEALAADGVRLSPDAEPRLIVLDVEAGDPEAAVEPVLAALREEGEAPLIAVTRSAWAIEPGDRTHAAHRAAWGLVKVAAAEQPDRLVAAIDLERDADWSALQSGLAAVAAGARWIAVRGGQALVQTLVSPAHAAPSLPPGGFADAGWHLVTGGFGGLGRLSARWLASQGARRVAVLAPRAPDDWPALAEALQASFGCDLRWIDCDVADRLSVLAALDLLAAEGGVAGAIHAAGVLDDAPLTEMEPGRLAAVLAVKARGADTLKEWLEARSGRYLILYSSAAAALGAPGQAAHAAASGYLDGLAEGQPRDGGLAVLSIAWGAWGETGRAADAALQERLAASGMGVLSTGEGLWHLEQAVMRGAPCRLAMRLLPKRLDPARRRLLQDPAASPQPRAGSPAAGEIAGLPAPSLDDADAVGAWLKAHIAAQLRLRDAGRLTPERDLVQLGLDSLLLLELRSTIERRLGVRIAAERAYGDLTIAGLSRMIVEAGAAEAPAAPALRHDAANRYEPFPLTPIQHAYWLGRTELIDYGGVACHILFEWDKRRDDFDLDCFEAAWNALVQRHDMLRMVVGPDGRQRVLAETPYYRLQRRDLKGLSAAGRERALKATRQELSARVLPADRWPLFELVVSECDDQRYRLHMNLDLLLFDVQSLKVMMDDLARAYRGEALAPLQISFRDYVLAEEARRSEPAWQASWRYWQDRLPDLPPAPRLPLATVQASQRPRFTTYQARLDRPAWERLKAEWRSWGVTPSAALLALFAQVLERWSRQPDFTLNLTFFNRRPDHPDVPQIIGDFTSVLLIDFDLSARASLRESIERTQQRLWRRLAHGQVNGVELLRELGRASGRSRQPLMPVVFTSMLGMSLDGMSIDQAMTRLLGDPAHVFTQTPQVWLDHQVMEIDGDLVFSWYCMDEVLADGVAEAMFEAYRNLLHAVAAEPDRMGEASWEPVARRPNPARPGASLDLHDIEDALRAREDIRAAEASFDAGNDILEIAVVGADDLPVAQAGCAPAFDAGALPAPTPPEVEEIDAVWGWLEARALAGIAETLVRHGLFAKPGERFALDEVQAQLSARPQHRRLIRQWLRRLAGDGWLRPDGNGFTCIRPLGEVPPAPEPRPASEWGGALSAYLDRCIASHDALLDGRQQPLSLLFGEGDAVTRALYSTNPVIRSLNEGAAQIARALGEASDDGLTVLEVGAGTAATTRHVLPTLDGVLKHYRFTDVSTLFLDEARAAFAAHAQVEYGLFDINALVDFEAHPAAGYDLVIAANVMHDAVHVVRSLRRLGKLLKPGGRLLLIEATEPDSALQMASIGFIEGLNGYQDFRTADDKPMLDLPAWRRVLQEAGYAVETAWPPQDDTPLRQHLMVARAERLARLDLGDIERDLRARFGDALSPLRLRQWERLPDPSAVAPAPSAKVTPAAAPRRQRKAPRELEGRVAAVWRSLLGRDVDAGSDFFQAGGDSLIATRMVAQLNREGIRDASLQSLFAHSTLGAFCATLNDAPAKVGDNPVLLARGRKADQVFLFHASDGELGAYLPLARRLDCEVHGLQATGAVEAPSLAALASRYVEAIRAVRPQGPYTLIGWSYGAFLAAEAARALHEEGERPELVLLDPVCRQDFAFADRAGLLRMLARGREDLVLPDNLEQLDQSEQNACFLRQATAAGLLRAQLTAEEAASWLEQMDRLFGLLAAHPAPRPSPVPCLWLSAARRPAHWRPAELDWGPWEATARRRTLDADHWSLVMDDARARETAKLIRQWRQRTARQEKVA